MAQRTGKEAAHQEGVSEAVAYADYTYYSAHFGVLTDEEEFNRLADNASRKLDVLTGRRAATATGYKAQALKDAVCNMVDYLHAVEQSGQGSGVSSVSNDGYSETYADSTPEAVEKSLRGIAFQWLSGTGLMGAL